MSDDTQITLHSKSTDAKPLAALRHALTALAKQMTERGVPPAALTGMTWTARSPAAIHPASAVTDLSYREVFGGFRPPVAVRFADHDGVHVTAQARQLHPPNTEKAWGGYTLAELAHEYSPRAYVSNMGAIFDQWRADGAAFRAQHLTAEIAYGTALSETFDFYSPAHATGALPLWVFIHGGYWQAIDKTHQGQFAAGMLAAGYAVAVPNYGLAPGTTIHQSLAQMQHLLAFLAREAAALGCDAGQIHIAGHSAGGQLVSMLACRPEGRLIKSALPLSGVFDLAPLAQLAFGPLVGLRTDTDVAQLSPIGQTPLPHIRLGAAVGGAESEEFQRQTALYAEQHSAPSRIIAGKNHFDLLDGLNSGELLDFAKAIARA